MFVRIKLPDLLIQATFRTLLLCFILAAFVLAAQKKHARFSLFLEEKDHVLDLFIFIFLSSESVKRYISLMSR